MYIYISILQYLSVKYIQKKKKERKKKFMHRLDLQTRSNNKRPRFKKKERKKKHFSN